MAASKTGNQSSAERYKLVPSRPSVEVGESVRLTVQPVGNVKAPPQEHVAVWRSGGKGSFADAFAQGTHNGERFYVTYVPGGERASIEWRPDPDTSDTEARISVQLVELGRDPNRSRNQKVDDIVGLIERGGQPDVVAGGGNIEALLLRVEDGTASARAVRIVGDVRTRPVGDGVPEFGVTLRRTGVRPDDQVVLWALISATTEALSYENYEKFIEELFRPRHGGDLPGGPNATRFTRLSDRRSLPFPDTDLYRVLKVATELFMQVNCGVFIDGHGRLDRSKLAETVSSIPGSPHAPSSCVPAAPCAPCPAAPQPSPCWSAPAAPAS